MPFKPDMTYFRGDLTRPIELWKVDVVRDEGPDQGKVTSVTYIRTIDATMFDSGTGLDTANVVARGPGGWKPGPTAISRSSASPSGKTASKSQNQLGPDGQVKQKIIVLSGSRPCFIDALKKTSLDSASTIWVWLKPKPASGQEPAARPPRHPAALPGTGTPAATPIIMASSRATAPSPSSASTQTKAGDDRSADGDLGGGGFQIDRLVALRDVHLLAPSKTMTARERLDADFVDAPPTVVASAPTTKAESTPNSPASEHRPAASPSRPSPGTWVGTELSPGRGSKSGTNAIDRTPHDRLGRTNLGQDCPGSGIEPRRRIQSNRTTKTTSTSGAPGSNAEVREVWMWGNVALHQDPAAGKTKGQEASGEAIYLDNRGKDKAQHRRLSKRPGRKDATAWPPPARPSRER